MKGHPGYVTVKGGTRPICAFGPSPGITGPAHQTVKVAHAIGRVTAMSWKPPHFRLTLNHMNIPRASRTKGMGGGQTGGPAPHDQDITCFRKLSRHGGPLQWGV